MRFKSNSKKRVGVRGRTSPQWSVRPSVYTPRSGWWNSLQAALPISRRGAMGGGSGWGVAGHAKGGEWISMVARTKQEKAVHVARLLDHLWHGRTEAALAYLRRDVQAKNPE